MVIQCSQCGRTYDGSGYPHGYTFACACGEVICVQKEDGAEGEPEAQEVDPAKIEDSEKAPQVADSQENVAEVATSEAQEEEAPEPEESIDQGLEPPDSEPSEEHEGEDENVVGPGLQAVELVQQETTTTDDKESSFKKPAQATIAYDEEPLLLMRAEDKDPSSIAENVVPEETDSDDDFGDDEERLERTVAVSISDLVGVDGLVTSDEEDGLSASFEHTLATDAESALAALEDDILEDELEESSGRLMGLNSTPAKVENSNVEQEEGALSGDGWDSMPSVAKVEGLNPSEENSFDDGESTAVVRNPLLQVGALVAGSEEEQGEFDQEESTAVMRNPLLDGPPPSAEPLSPPLISQNPLEDSLSDALAAELAGELQSEPTLRMRAPELPSAALPTSPSSEMPSSPPHTGAFAQSESSFSALPAKLSGDGLVAQVPAPLTPVPTPMPLPASPSPMLEPTKASSGAFEGIGALASTQKNAEEQQRSHGQTVDQALSEPVENDPSLLQSEPRAFLSFVLCFFLLLGPLACWLGLRSLRRIRNQPDVFRGSFWAVLGAVFGGVQTIGMIGILVLLMLPTESFPLAGWFRTSLGLSGDIGEVFYPSQKGPVRLSAKTAASILGRAVVLGERRAKPSTLFVYQEPDSRQAEVHWFDRTSKKGQRSLFAYSNEGRWHLVSFAVGKGYEVRCAKPGEQHLEASLVRSLIQDFWQLRGRFSHVKIEHLYVQQEKGSHRAYAYWKLAKQPPGGQRKAWYIKSLLHYSNQNKWHLSRYAIRTESDEEYAYWSAGNGPLKSSQVRDLLGRQSKANKTTFSPSQLHIFQEPSQPIAYVHWRNANEAGSTKSLFRLSNGGKWFLARPRVSSGGLVNWARSGSLRLSAQVARDLILRYWNARKRKLLLQELYVYQPKNSHLAYARWRVKGAPKKKRLFQSLLYRTNNGMWVLSRATTNVSYQVQFEKAANGPLTTAIAKELIHRYWRSSEDFVGAQIKEIYTYQSPGGSVALAHWSMFWNGTKTRMQTKFFLSNRRRWVLGQYDMGERPFLRFRAPGEPRLSLHDARSLLQAYLKVDKAQRNKLLSLFVFQAEKSRVALVRWVRSDKKVPKPMTATFHRSNQGDWYLSSIQDNQTFASRE